MIAHTRLPAHLPIYLLQRNIVNMLLHNGMYACARRRRAGPNGSYCVRRPGLCTVHATCASHVITFLELEVEVDSFAAWQLDPKARYSAVH